MDQSNIDLMAAVKVANAQSRARVAVLGPVAGACCRPEEGQEPCLACAVPGDEPEARTGTGADWQAAWARYRQGHASKRPLSQTFVEQLYLIANELGDDPDDVRSWVGGQVAKIAEQARYLEAKGPESFEDRKQAALDALACRIEAGRAAAW